MNKRHFILSTAAACLVAATALADQPGRLDIRTVVEKEQRAELEDGTTTVELVPADAVVPGEEVIYTVTYTNISGAPTDNIVISNPIPAELTYVHGSAFGPGTRVSFSVDGGATYGSPETLVVLEDGEPRAATNADFTNIRWQVEAPLLAGQRGFARFRARLN